MPGLAGIRYEGLGVVTQTATLHVSADFSPVGAGPRRPDPLDLLPAGRRSGRDGPDRAGSLGPALEGMGDPPQLPGGDRSTQSDAQVEADARTAPASRTALEDPQDNALVGRGGDGVRVPGWPRVPAGRRGHRHPPTGGLGLTSAIHDAQNLCWKLALVLAGDAAPALLDTYEAERRRSMSATRTLTGERAEPFRDRRGAQRPMAPSSSMKVIEGATCLAWSTGHAPGWPPPRRSSRRILTPTSEEQHVRPTRDRPGQERLAGIGLAG